MLAIRDKKIQANKVDEHTTTLSCAIIKATVNRFQKEENVFRIAICREGSEANKVGNCDFTMGKQRLAKFCFVLGHTTLLAGELTHYGRFGVVLGNW